MQKKEKLKIQENNIPSEEALLKKALSIKKIDVKRCRSFLEQSLDINKNGIIANLAYLDCLSPRIDAEIAQISFKRLNDQNLDSTQLTELAKQYLRFGQELQAWNSAREAHEKEPNNHKTWSYILRVARHVADWDLAEKIQEKLIQAHHQSRTADVNETPRTHLLWCSDEAINQKVLSIFSARHFPEQKEQITVIGEKNKNQKIRIGYISYDFRDHPTALLLLGLIRHHDKNIFELYAYCASYDDGSAMRREILNRFNKMQDISNLSPMRAAELIKKDEIDILIDLNGLTEGAQFSVLAYKPAPVIISYLGFPGTVGNRYVDYIVADEVTIPLESSKYYSEKIIRLPDTYQINDYRARYLSPISNRPAPLNKGPVLGMFNNINKVERDVWTAWMKIMQQVPETTLFVLNPGDLAYKNLINVTKKFDISPKRIVRGARLKQDAHLARLQWCDLMLDPWPYGGHTTTSDAIFAGVPVITLKGSNFASRVSGGLLMAAELNEFIARDREEYISKTVNFLRSPQRLEEIKKKLLRERMNMNIFDSVSRTRYFEMALKKIVERSRSGLKPVNINIVKQKSKKR